MLEFLFIFYHLIMLIVFAVLYYKAAEIDNGPTWVWASASAAWYTFTWKYLNYGFVGNALGQGVLLIVIGIVRAAFFVRATKETPKERRKE